MLPKARREREGQMFATYEHKLLMHVQCVGIHRVHIQITRRYVKIILTFKKKNKDNMGER